MGWQDRDYNRSQGRGLSNPLEWILYGQVPLFRVSGISVRAHASLVILLVLAVFFGFGFGGHTWVDRLEGIAALFTIVLLHEFGHCFTARWVGGTANDIVMTPIGGLAFARAPQRPLPQFLTVAGGPAVNVVICLLCGIAIFAMTGQVILNPLAFRLPWDFDARLIAVVSFAFWIYSMSLFILLFNLLPIFPLDGGQMLQAILWPKMGYVRSMLLSCNIGMVGAVVVGLYGISTGATLLVFIAISGFMTCQNMRRQLLAAGPMSEPDPVDYSAAYQHPQKAKQPSRWAQKRAARAVEQERQEQQQIDTILAKVSAQGMQSLSSGEKRALKKATENQRRRDEEKAAMRRRTIGR